MAVGVFVESAGGAKPGVEQRCCNWATVPDQGLESVQPAGVGVLPRRQASFLLEDTLQVGGADADGLAQLGKGRQAIGVLVEVRVDLMADMSSRDRYCDLLVVAGLGGSAGRPGNPPTGPLWNPQRI